jgi:predicted Zn-dependent peptidase
MNPINRYLRAGLALAVALAAALPVAAQVSSYEDIKYPKLNDIRIPDIKKVELDNGMKLYLVEDSEVPLISISARIRAGSAWEPADKIGLASITGQVMRTGGTENRTGDELDDLLESLAASVETSIGETSGSAFMSVLEKDLDVGLEILADVLMHPAFAEDKIDLAKVQAKSAISRRNDDPNGIVSREFAKTIYGGSSPYARTTEYATIDAITRDDLVAFHDKWFHPNNVMLAVWGDFDADEMVTHIETAFADWEKKEDLELPPLPEVNYDWGPSVSLVADEDATQSVIRFGHLGMTQDDPDYFAVIVMNRVLGAGGFSSRLFQEVRSRRGLAYMVGGGIQANVEYPGMATFVSSTKSESTVETVKAMMHEVDRITREKVTEEELALAKEAYLNSFVFNFDTTSEIVNRVMLYDYYGYPEDFLQKTKENVEKVTVDDVLRVAQAHLRPDDLRLVVLGNPADFDEDLAALGQDVDLLDITIPVAAAEMISEATAEDVARGEEVLGRMVDALGGAEAVGAVTNLRVNADISITTPQGAMAASGEILTVYPDRMAAKLSLPFGEMTQVLAGETGWAKSPMGDQDMGPSELADARGNVFRDLVNLARLAGTETLTVQYLGNEEFQGAPADVIHLSDGTTQVKVYVDPETGMPRGESYQGQTMMGPAAMTEIYGDWREVAGVQVPFSIETLADGKPMVETTITRADANVEVDEALFTK